jgi:hypothetical protein
MNNTFDLYANRNYPIGRLPSYGNPETGLASRSIMSEQSSFLDQPTLNPFPNMSDTNFSMAPNFLYNELDSQAGQCKYHTPFKNSKPDEISYYNRQELN